jgi:hypothetical protein
MKRPFIIVLSIAFVVVGLIFIPAVQRSLLGALLSTGPKKSRSWAIKKLAGHGRAAIPFLFLGFYHIDPTAKSLAKSLKMSVPAFNRKTDFMHLEFCKAIDRHCDPANAFDLAPGLQINDQARLFVLQLWYLQLNSSEELARAQKPSLGINPLLVFDSEGVETGLVTDREEIFEQARAMLSNENPHIRFAASKILACSKSDLKKQ